MQIQKVIQSLGFTQSEVKVYLAALQLGGSRVLDIAQISGLPRTTVQEIVLKLNRDGLMNPITRENRKYWVAENPDKLLATLKERQSALQTVMPELQALRFDTGVKPSIRSLAGVQEIPKVFEDILDAKHHILAIVSWQDWIEVLGEETVNDFIQQRAERFLKMRLLTPRSDHSIALKKNDDKYLRTTRFLPLDFEIHTSTFIYDGRVAIISLNKKLPVGTIIHDHDIAETMRLFFETLWEKNNPLS